MLCKFMESSNNPSNHPSNTFLYLSWSLKSEGSVQYIEAFRAHDLAFDGVLRSVCSLIDTEEGSVSGELRKQYPSAFFFGCKDWAVQQHIIQVILFDQGHHALFGFTELTLVFAQRASVDSTVSPSDCFCVTSLICTEGLQRERRI